MFLVSKNITIKATLSHNLTNSVEDNRKKKDIITDLDENNIYIYMALEWQKTYNYSYICGISVTNGR